MTSLRAFACAAALVSIPFAPSPQDKPAVFVLEPGEHEILNLIQRSGQFLGRTYMLDKTQNPQLCQVDAPGNKIQIDRRLELDAQACEEVVGQMLHTRGWIAMATDAERGVHDWIFLGGPRQFDLRKYVRRLSADEIRARPRVIDYVATTVRLHHANAQLASANLRQFFNDPRGLDQILPLGGNNQRSLMIVGLRPTVASILSVLQDIDLPDPEEPTLATKVAELEMRLQKVEAALKEKR